MPSTSRMPVWAWTWTLAATTAAGLMVIAGCALSQPGNGPSRVFEKIGGDPRGGKLLLPKQCLLNVQIINRPFRDPAINEAVWHVADEQFIEPRQRKALAANGLRVGRIIGDLPKELETVLRTDGPDRALLQPSNLLVESGQSSLVSTTPKIKLAALLITLDNRVKGRDFRDVTGYLRLTPQHRGGNAVALRLTPELHHGPVRRTFPLQTATPGVQPQQLSIRDAQTEETLNELGIDMVLEDGQVAVIGCRPENLQSLGTFLFAQEAAENVERRQRLVLIHASRNLSGEIPKDEPKGLERLFKKRKRVEIPNEPPPSALPPDPTPPPPPESPK